MEVTLLKSDLFALLALASDSVEECQRGKFLDRILNELTYLGGKELAEAAKSYFILKDKPIFATRIVPISTPEEVGDNGLFWKDLRK